jgi:hypothetical protein
LTPTKSKNPLDMNRALKYNVHRCTELIVQLNTNQFPCLAAYRKSYGCLAWVERSKERETHGVDVRNDSAFTF